jgi:hypothetical protein
MRQLYRSVGAPIRKGLSWQELWAGPDDGLIACWERGREKRIEEPELARRAEQGELVTLAWKGGTENIEEPIDGEKKPKSQKRYGSLKYLATWQGLRGEDLKIELDKERTIVCSRANRPVIFRAASLCDQ